jgi:hypothetical protein
MAAAILNCAMEFVCPDPTATVRAANVKATLDAFTLVPHVGRRLIARHGLELDDLGPDEFILVQRWLDALREIQHAVGPDKVRDVGRNIIESAAFPPSFPGAEAILLDLDDIYHRNHRGDVGRYVVSREGAAIVVRCETPYPSMFEWGLVDGICRNARAGGRFDVQYDPGPAGGDLTCTLRVQRI